MISDIDVVHGYREHHTLQQSECKFCNLSILHCGVRLVCMREREHVVDVLMLSSHLIWIDSMSSIFREDWQACTHDISIIPLCCWLPWKVFCILYILEWFSCWHCLGVCEEDFPILSLSLHSCAVRERENDCMCFEFLWFYYPFPSFFSLRSPFLFSKVICPSSFVHCLLHLVGILLGLKKILCFPLSPSTFPLVFFFTYRPNFEFSHTERAEF